MYRRCAGVSVVVEVAHYSVKCTLVCLFYPVVSVPVCFHGVDWLVSLQ
jgi:hypothetical protein